MTFLEKKIGIISLFFFFIYSLFLDLLLSSHAFAQVKVPDYKGKSSVYEPMTTSSDTNENKKSFLKKEYEKTFSNKFFSINDKFNKLPKCQKGYKHDCVGYNKSTNLKQKYLKRYYYGQFKDNKLHGFGAAEYSDGASYVGQFKDSRFHGKGIFTFANGRISQGQYVNGKANGPTVQYRKNKIIIGYMSGIKRIGLNGRVILKTTIYNIIENAKFSNGKFIKGSVSKGYENWSEKEICDHFRDFSYLKGKDWYKEIHSKITNHAKNNQITCSDNILKKQLKVEKERDLAKEKTRKKKIEEEKARKKKLAAEKTRKKKLAEEERKRKLTQEKLNTKINDYKRKAKNFYKDIEEFVKAGGNVDLVSLSDYFDIKPDPKNKWNKSDLSRYEELREFMTSIPQFVTFEKERIGERLKKSFAKKDESIAALENNLQDLKGLMRKMFGSSDMSKIKRMIKDIETNLANFNQSKANKIIVQTTSYITSKLPKSKKIEKNMQTDIIKNVSLDQSWSEFKSKLIPQQEQFCNLTEKFHKDLSKAIKSKNEIMVNNVHKERQINLDGLIPYGKINNWIFKVIKIDQVEDGSAAVVLSLHCKSFVGSGQIHTKSTWRKKSNKEWRATIPYEDRRFRELAKLDFGQFILGSGTFLEINAFKPGQIETFYASQQIGEHPLTKELNLEGELFLADLSYIAALN